MTGMASTGRCVAQDAGGHRCILGAAGDHRHIYANHSYYLGKLHSAVQMFLAGHVDRDFLASVLAEVEADA